MVASDWRVLLRELVELRYDDLVAYAHTLSGSRADAEDLVSEALLATFSRPRSLNNVHVAEAYVRRAIASKFIDSKRKGTREARAFQSVGQGLVDKMPAADAGMADVDALGSALAQLSPRERTCVVMRYLDQLTVAETALALKLAEGSVKRYVSDGLTKLNQLLGTQEFDAELVALNVREGGATR